MRRNHVRTCVTWGATATLAALCSGCLSVASLPVALAGAAGSVVEAGVAIGAHDTTPYFVTGTPVKVSGVCIENNPAIVINDLLPAMQDVLRRRGVTSAVYSPGTAPPSCSAVIEYAATTSWDKPALGGDVMPYINSIDLTLSQRGTVVITARYEVRGLELDKFASAQTKLSGLLSHMIVKQ
jgi:hypothetical protein